MPGDDLYRFMRPDTVGENRSSTSNIISHTMPRTNTTHCHVVRAFAVAEGAEAPSSSGLREGVRDATVG